MIEKNKDAFIAIDESLFSYINNEHIWLIGLIDTNNKYFRIEAVKDRGTETMKKIICHHIDIGNNIITDGWGSYQWLDNPIYGYRRIIYIHGNLDFGFTHESTSQIESVWSDLKRLLSKIYTAIQSSNFIYFPKECEFRKKIANLNNQKKLHKLQEIFKHISSTVEQHDLFTKDDLEDFNKEFYEDDVIENDSDSSNNYENDEQL